MADPVTDVMQEGHGAMIGFDLDPDIFLHMEETEVTPPGFDGGGPIDMTSHRNAAYRTKAAKFLKEITNGSITVFWNPAVYENILAMGNKNQLITFTLPEGTTIAVWGYLNTFQPGAVVSGSAPTAQAEVVVTLLNNDREEVDPVVVVAA